MEVWELRDGFGPPHLRLGERPEPEPGRGQVLLRMRAAALNYRDTVVIRGGYGARVTVPLIPVSDGVGEVVAIGAGVVRVRVGDRVAPMFFPDWQGGSPAPGKFSRTLGGPLDGVLCRQMCIDAEAVASVPDHLSDVEAACLPCAALTAWNALISQGRVRPGQSVLIQGTGGVALFAVQFARLAGARVILTSTSDEKLLRARALGVDETINSDREPDWDRRVKELTAGEGCDHVVELGGAATLERSLRAVRIGGTVSLIGVLSGADAQL